MVYCAIAPPDPPQPIVCLGGPTVSMNRSFTIISVSAETTPLQLLPNTLSEDEATA